MTEEGSIMFFWACAIWPLVLGALLGWLLCGWLARSLRGRDWSGLLASKDAELARTSKELADWRKKPPVQVETVVEKIVEKIVEKPVDRVVEKVIERTVDNPSHLASIARLTAEVAVVAGLRHRISELENAPPKVVEKVIEKAVPDTAGLAERDAQIKRLMDGPALDFVAAKQAGFDVKGADDLAIIEGIGPKIAELMHQKGIHTFMQLAAITPAKIQPLLDEAGPHYRMANPETWPEQAELAARNRWSALRSLQDVLIAGVRVDAAAQKEARDQVVRNSTQRIHELEQQLAQRELALRTLRSGPPIDLAAAHAAGFTSVKGDDNLEIVEGIGPKIAELLKAAGIHRFSELAATSPAQIQTILDAAGSNYRLASPDTWPEQAELAMRNRWRALKSLQDVLIAGNRQ
jgi:predicted flap endonuclease-1-like 5' DNA nuclease